jgi:hypothetical protein
MDGSVACWGTGADGRLGNGMTSDAVMGVPVSGLSDAQWIAAGFDHTCAARRAMGGAVCWGNGAQGQLGSATATSSTPLAVTGLP